jgi:hypothetical protein
MVRDSHADQVMFDESIRPIGKRGLYGTVREACLDVLPTPFRQRLSMLKSKVAGPL